MKVKERTLEKNQMLFRRTATWSARADDKVNRNFFQYRAPKGLTPYLYLFETEAFSAYLQAPSSGLRGLPIPNAT